MSKKKEEKENIFKNEKTPKIYPVIEEPPDPRIKPVHPHMIQPPALLLGIGAVKSGKTTTLNSILLQEREDGFFGQDYFDQVTIISNTIGNDPTARFLKKAFDVKDYYKDGDILEIIKKQDSFGEKKNMPFIALLLDDILGSNMKRNNEISFLATRFRHKNIGLMGVFVQNFKSVDTILRNNATDIIIFRQTNNKQLLQIAEEYHGQYGDMTTFMKIYKIATEGKYNFLYLKIQDGTAYRNFETMIADGSNILVNDNVDISDLNMKGGGDVDMTKLKNVQADSQNKKDIE